MKKFCIASFKVTAISMMVMSPYWALIAYCSQNQWDPIKEIQRLMHLHRRDEAIDLVRFLRNSRLHDDDELTRIEEDVAYGHLEKAKAFILDGAIKGQVSDTYSGIGAMAADCCLFGDIRDITIQTWNTFFDKDEFNGVIATLAGAGIALSTVPMFDVINAFAKNTAKYIKRLPAFMNQGMLKTFLSGRTTPEQCTVIYDLLKKTTGPFPVQQPA